LIAASFVVLGLVGVLVPKVFELRPPFSESPAGLFVIFARGEALAMVAMAAIATVVAAAITPPPRGVDPAA
jgi:hypothetical protein